MEYSEKTQKLIDRICALANPKDCVLDKEKSEEFILKIYDLFNLERPKKVVWSTDFSKEVFYKDLSEKNFTKLHLGKTVQYPFQAANKAFINSSAYLAFADVENYWEQQHKQQSTPAGKAKIFLWTKLEKLFYALQESQVESLDRVGWPCALNYVFMYEYRQNPSGDTANNNDILYLEYCKLQFCALSAGLGARVEHDGILYLMPVNCVERLRVLNDAPTKSVVIKNEANNSIVKRIPYEYLSPYTLEDIAVRLITPRELIEFVEEKEKSSAIINTLP